MKGEKNIFQIIKTKNYIRKEKNKKYYPNYGLEVYVRAVKENGKTITAVRRIKNILEAYPELTFITNVEIKGIDNAIYFKTTEELIDRLKEIDINNNKGYLIFIDEIHVVLAELFGKSDPIFLTFLSQQRKLSIHIIGTSQMFNKLPKFIRDYLIQSGQVISCNKWLGCIQTLRIANMETAEEDKKGNITFRESKIQWYIHTPELYESYNTFAVISQIQGLMKNKSYNVLERNEENDN